jgi:hypothetical protein
VENKPTNIWKNFIQSLPLTFVAMALTAVGVLAATGTLDSPAEPESTSSYTLEDVYQRLENGTAGTQSTFTEPAVAPGTGTMHTINDIVAAAPALDNTYGATTAAVLSGKTFWGLTNGEWGLQTGTIPSRSSVTGPNGSILFTIPDGYYQNRTAKATDSDLLSKNIVQGVNIFGVQGSYSGSCTCEGTMVGSRWCDNGDGTVTDMLGYEGNGVCLVWLKQADCLGKKPWSIASGDDAITKVSLLENGQCGLTDGSGTGDWWLPTASQMRIVAQGTDSVRSYSMRAFTGVLEDAFYWTSTGFSTTYAARYDMRGGTVGVSLRETNLNLWAVRYDD